MTILLLILVAVCLEVAGQTLYKAGLNRTPAIVGSMRNPENVWTFAFNVVTSWRVMLGLLVYVSEVFLWWIVLARVDVSYAFPLTSTSYILLLLASRLWLHEDVPPVRWLGACTIMAGVYLITRSAPLPH